ncbi:MAG: 8-amino-7-oxononanoate synthase, partial [Planctomycetes bacterium]|nr:8-amino-7-oxononanoate synthase [Planctomycetota bacterium]
NLRCDPRVIEAACNAAKRFGVGSGASRLISGTTLLHEELESKLAAWYGSEAALIFSSGYHANVGVLSCLADPETLLVCDALNHASLIDGARLSGAQKTIVPHLDLEAFAKALDGSNALRTLIVSDALFSIDGDRANIEGLRELSNNFGVALLLDDAHGLGALGEEGRGIAGSADVTTATLSKAFGSLGGVVFSSTEVREHLLNHARSFVFSTAADMPSLGAALAAHAIIASSEGDVRRKALKSRAEQLRQGLMELGLETSGDTHIVPLWLGESQRALELSKRLQDAGFFAPAVRPPTVPDGRAMLRFSLHAGIEEVTISKILDVLRKLSR